MADWIYQGIDARGRLFTGPIEAADADEAAHRLQQQGLLTTRLVPHTQAGGTSPVRHHGRRRIDRATLLAFTDALSGLLRAGLTIEQSLTVALTLSLPPAAHLLIADARHDVRAGISLSESLAQVDGIPTYYVSLVHNGELTGDLGAMLARLQKAIARSAEIRAGILNAAIYPALLVVVMLLSLLFLFIDVVPRFAAMFARSSIRLPAATRALLAVATFLHRNMMGLSSGVLASIILLMGAWRSPGGRASLERLVLHIPALGPIIVSLELGRVFRTMAALLAAGIPLTQALTNIWALPGPGTLRSMLHTWHERLVAGESPAQAVASLPLLPAFVRQFIAMGNETGRMDDVLSALADRLEHDTDRAIHRALSLVEPAAILVMGLIVGAVVVSILAAVFALNTVHIST